MLLNPPLFKRSAFLKQGVAEAANGKPRQSHSLENVTSLNEVVSPMQQRTPAVVYYAYRIGFVSALTGEQAGNNFSSVAFIFGPGRAFT